MCASSLQAVIVDIGSALSLCRGLLPLGDFPVHSHAVTDPLSVSVK